MSRITYMPASRAQPTTCATRSRYCRLNFPRSGSSMLHDIGRRMELKPSSAILLMSSWHSGGVAIADEVPRDLASAYAAGSLGEEGGGAGGKEAGPPPKTVRAAGKAPGAP